jgi:hypothetical protein
MIFRKKLRLMCYLKKRFLKKKIVLISILLFLFIMKIFVNKKNDFDDLLYQLKTQNIKSVQLITGRFDWANWGLNELGTKPFENCKEKRCYAFRSFIVQQANVKRYVIFM